MNKLYLAGGFIGGWQDEVIKQLQNNFIIFDPLGHALKESNKYTHWDLFYVDKCDILFGYMSESNPSGYGLALEIGYARAKNKLIILVDERSKKDNLFKKYFAICHESTDVICSSLQEAIEYLKAFKF
ncbi:MULTISPECIES: nucleoside 2-deoxyribosyltransferase domain-containing protein [Sphingobacterium]|uniref:nucleoside 2-deoxyribosyltransferase domain-containing protein n=1 Tax=Sphingobacterium TaxID=28453 RepID=UPI00104327DE|nr:MULTISPECIES: nucleoside 2-deoxyribosyltransferase domain-containing protein [Sphingobacterium]MCW2260114.1 nucleoside 2-deoxyribosyltransferase [Sphingobacterium kitahiroshimense]TCR11095.1 hypothetical protein EDF67_104188 [Sphingobacterium sp. JUb78]